MAIAVGILVITIRENKLREEVEKAEGKRRHHRRKKRWPKAEAAGEIEAVGDTGEAKAEEKQKTAKTESAKDMPKDEAQYVLHAGHPSSYGSAYNAVTTAFSPLYESSMEDGGRKLANCLMVATSILSYIPIGNISAKIGRKKTIMGGVLLMAACYGGAIFAREYHIVNVAFALIGMAAINVNSYPMIVAMSSGSDGEIHRNSLYVLHGSADPDSGTI